MNINPLSTRLQKYLKDHQIEDKYQKQILILAENPKHPSLNIELLEPKNHCIYSFRVDRKYRALFIYREDNKSLEIISITLHYH